MNKEILMEREKTQKFIEDIEKSDWGEIELATCKGLTRSLQGTEVPCPKDMLVGNLGTRYFSAVQVGSKKNEKK